MNKDLIIQLQQEQLKLQNEQILDLQVMVSMMKVHIETLENNQKKDSSNSSKPPSSDIGKIQRTKSLRTQSGKKPGGQHGHRGETLSFSATPNEVVVHEVKKCNCCGKNISDIGSSDYERRQVFDIPPIEMAVTEHRGEIKGCPYCDSINRAEFPQMVSQPIQYGCNVQQLAVYFTQYQLLPYGRTAEIFKDLYGHNLSDSFLVNNNQRCAVKLQPFIADLKSTLLAQPVLHVDETGYYFEGLRNWLHTICTDKHTLYAAHSKRGTEAMNDMAVLPLYQGMLVHDFWKPYQEFTCSHSLCNVHHLRDLTFCHEVEKSSWAGSAKKLLLDIHKKVQAEKDIGTKALSRGQRFYWSKKYDDLMQVGMSMHPIPKKKKGKRGVAKKSKTQNMIERFINHKDSILAFANNFLIPFGNNLAEQAIRMMKVKQKISGCFRSENGAKNFADIRSYIATAKKQGMPIMQAIASAIKGQAFQITG